MRAEQQRLNAEWYRALSLTERRLLEPAGSHVPASSALAERARNRLRAWKAQKGFDQGPLFAQRLALESLDEKDLLALLAEPAESLKARSHDAPDWLTALQAAFAEATPATELAPVFEQVGGDHPLAGCLPTLGPLFQRALSLVQESMHGLQQQGAFLPFDAGILPAVLVTNIAPAVLYQLSKPVILELHIARLQGRLQGETSEARFADFIRGLNDDQGIVPLLAKYPVLARQLIMTIDQWAAYLSEFLTHLCNDWEALCQTFAADLGPLVELEAGKGDPHRRGRSVLLLRFGSGKQLLYKPKPLAVDVHFQELLGWLNQRGADPPLRPLTLLDRGRYGWSEFVAASPCESKEQVRRFYQRQGGYLAVLYALDATDLHNENLIAAGEHPMLVDLEALFHPHVHGREPILTEVPAAGALDESVWQVGLLPRRMWSDEDSLGIDMSGLGGQPGQMNPHRLVSWDKPGTDEMRLVRRHAEMPASENRPRFGGKDVEVVNYADDVITGFTTMYRLLWQHKDALMAEQLPRFANDEIRVIVRSTNIYGLLLYESFHPDLLRDALDRDRFLDRLWMEARRYPYLARVIPAEQRDLLRGDIPMFTTTPDSRAIFTSEHEAIDDFLEISSSEGVRARVRQLSEEDLARQRWIIEASLATLLMSSEDRIPRPARAPGQGRRVARDQLLQLATSMGKRLDELAFHDTESASWLAVGPLDELTWGMFPAGPDLYAGNGGIALFLTYLGAVTGEPSFALLADRALVSVRRQVRAWLEAADEPAGGSPPAIGAFEGMASTVYVLTNLGVVRDEPDLLREAENLAESLARYVPADNRLDVIYGSAGCVLSLLALDAVRPSTPILEVATRCGDRLLATAQHLPHGTAWTTLEDQPPLGGFSHGTAGIALSLLKLAARTGEDRFRRAALDALAYDRSLFVPELDNWVDLRVFASRGAEQDQRAVPPTSMVAWCHGAAGIGLGRLAALDQLDEARARDDIDRALRATREYGFAMNHSLCHGASGNIELLLTAAQLLGRPEDHDALHRATAQLVASIESNGAVTGVPLSVETPGFMTGLAGIGYELLRLAEPDRVPDALVLAPPRW